MKLALRHTLPPGASLGQCVSAAVIEARLVTEFAHAGIVIGDTLYHSTGAKGVHEEITPDLTGWTLIDLGEMRDARALALFNKVKGSGYDWISLTSFVVITSSSDSQRWYCFELAWLLMTGTAPRERVTGEMLLVQALSMGGLLMTAPPPVRAIPFDLTTGARA
jgi:hypothetical protein